MKATRTTVPTSLEVAGGSYTGAGGGDTSGTLPGGGGGEDTARAGGSGGKSLLLLQAFGGPFIVARPSIRSYSVSHLVAAWSSSSPNI